MERRKANSRPRDIKCELFSMWCCFCWQLCNGVCHSYFEYQTHCYRRVIQETCNTSAADINVFNTVIYNAKLWKIIHTSCTLGESLYVCYYCNQSFTQESFEFYSPKISKPPRIFATLLITTWLLKLKINANYSTAIGYLFFCYQDLCLQVS